MEKYKQQKLEFQRESFREELREKLGHVCCNCGSDLDIEYHHIVPLALGGSNKLTNIVPLCYVCHQIAHGSKNIRRIKRAENIGRPRKLPVDDFEEVLNAYLHGDIGHKECKKRLGMSDGMKLTDAWYFKEFINDRHIMKYRNRVDTLNTNKCRKVSHKGEMLACIYYDDGTVFMKMVE